MAALFLLALVLLVWQALRTKPVNQPDFEISTQAGEQLSPVAVPSWRPPLDPPEDRLRRLAFLDQRAVRWPLAATVEEEAGCRLFLRISSQHWTVRPAIAVPGTTASWRRFYLPAGAFLDDDNNDGDPLDAGELRDAGPGAEAEVFCPAAAPASGSPR